MKLSISTLGCPNYSLDQAAQLLHSCKVGGIEIRGLDGELEITKMHCFDATELEHTRATLERYGLRPVCLGSSVAMHRDGDNVMAAMADVKRCSEVGIPAIRIFGNNLPRDGEQRSQKLRSIADDIARLCRLAAPLGVGIWLETHGDINTVETLSEIIRACAGLQNFGIIWDIAHTTSQNGGFCALLDEIYPYVRHIHIKDCKTMPGGSTKLCLPGQGELPIRDIVCELNSRGYDGYYSFEWEKLWHPELEEPEVAFMCFVEYMRRI